MIVYIGEQNCKIFVVEYCPVRRDNEIAYISINGNICWIKMGITGSVGKQLCGGFFKEEIFRFTGCRITLSAAASETIVPLAVSVWTNLDGDADDESFGIDNVVISKVEEGILKGFVRVKICIVVSLLTCAHVNMDIHTVSFNINADVHVCLYAYRCK